MINGLEGIPGSGKSYEGAVFQALAALKQGRKIITNWPLVREAYAAIDPAFGDLIEFRYAAAPVRGVWNPDAIDPETGKGSAFTLFEDGHVDAPAPNARAFGTVWCYWSDWKHPKTGHGPLFLIDECHLPMPKIGTSAEVIQWYKLHRHFNNDVLLATQQFRDMCQDIAGIMAMVIKVRKADVLGRSDQYIRKVHAGLRGAEIQRSIRDYEPHFFALYKSHTQGNAVLESGATDVDVLSVKIRKWTRMMWGLCAVAVAFAVWFNTRDKPIPNNAPGFKGAWIKQDGKTDYKAVQRDLLPPHPAAAEPQESAPKEPAGPALDSSGRPEPFAGKSLHLTGVMNMKGRILHTFALAAGGAVITQVTSDELQRAGYSWEAMTDCIGYLRWGTSQRAIVCDSPRPQGGTTDRPIVLMDGHGSDGRTPAPAQSKPLPQSSFNL